VAFENSIQNPEASVPGNLRGAMLMAFLKKSCQADRAFILSFPKMPKLRLRMVSVINPLEEDVIRLTNWRNRNVHSFLTEFEATPTRTRDWLTQIVANDISRILFMIEETGCLPMGYIGLASIDYFSHSAEADAVVRGEPDHPGAMSEALRTLISWSYESLGMERIGVRVLADNPAIAFYKKFGFHEIRKEALKFEKSLDMAEWKPIKNGESEENIRWLIHMEFID